MKLENYIEMLGGLALFLYGMQMMSAGMEAAAGNRMKQILEKLTSNRFKGIAVGAVITALIQSSSATTVMVVGFVNSGMMALRQAVWIIMGANIGTTITGQLIALDVGAIAPLIAFVGVALVVFLKKPKAHHIGNILAGLGILFIGMSMMSGAMKPLRDMPEFVNLLTKFQNPLLGITAGMLFTALVQSSSASIGILQALAASGAIGLSGAAYVLFGQNIGTCITALLASIGTNRSAKRTTIIHISFNVIGTLIFTLLCIITPLIPFVEELFPGNAPGQIANLHTIFNVTTTLLLIPFGNMLASLAERILPNKEEEEGARRLCYLQDISGMREDRIGISAISMEGTYKEIMRMFEMAKTNVLKSFTCFGTQNTEMMPEMEETEDYIDFLNKEISKYISEVITHERTVEGSSIFNGYFKISSNIERIGDHAMNISEYCYMLKEKNVTFSDMAKKEIEMMQLVCQEVFDNLADNEKESLSMYGKIASLEQKMDDMTEDFRNNMFDRIQQGTCSDEGSILFSEMLTDFERIGDHALNIAEEFVKIENVKNGSFS